MLSFTDCKAARGVHIGYLSRSVRVDLTGVGLAVAPAVLPLLRPRHRLVCLARSGGRRAGCSANSSPPASSGWLWARLWYRLRLPRPAGLPCGLGHGTRTDM